MKGEIEARINREFSEAEMNLINLCEAFRAYIASEGSDEKFPEVKRNLEKCWDENYSEKVTDNFEILHSVFHRDYREEDSTALGYYDEAVCNIVELIEKKETKEESAALFAKDFERYLENGSAENFRHAECSLIYAKCEKNSADLDLALKLCGEFRRWYGKPLPAGVKRICKNNLTELYVVIEKEAKK